MKNTRFLPLLFLLAIIVSCSKPTNEDKIKKSFEKYVEINFNDPRDLKEITSVELVDSFSTKDFKNKVKECFEIQDSVVQLYNSLEKRLNELVNTTPYGVGYFGIIPKREEAMNLLSQNASQLGNMIRRISMGILKDSEEFEYLQNFPDTTIYCYELKYRINDNGKLVIKSIYANADEKAEQINYSTEKYDFNEDLVNFIKECKEAIDSANEFIRVYRETCINQSKLITIVEESLRN